MEALSDNDSDIDVFQPKKSKKSSHKQPNSEDTSLDCKFCKKKFTWRKNLLSHERKCQQSQQDRDAKDTSLDCNLCQKKFTFRQNLLRHKSKCIGEVKGRFMCHLCDKRFTSKSFLSSHFNKVHCEGGSFICQFCSRSFKRKDNCLRHESVCIKNPQKVQIKTKCPYCSVLFGRDEHLERHLKRGCTAENPKKPKKKIPCLIKDCNSKFLSKKELIQHLTALHNDQITIEPKKSFSFVSFVDFQKWKETEEHNTFSHFTTQAGPKRKTKHYYCQHDGPSAPHSRNKKGRKTARRNKKGRIKVGHCCLAKMIVKLTDDSGPVQVDYWPTHTHKHKKADMLHHPLPSEMSEFINQKLACGIPSDVVYDLAKKIFIPRDEKVLQTPANILTKKRVAERGRRLRNKRRLHEDDAQSVFLLAEKLRHQGDHVLIYKPLGRKIVIGPEDPENLISSDDLFMFGFQTKEQRETMEKYCSEMTIVDETHGTNPYKVKLLTVMVVDSFNHGWPVAHLLTSNSDACTLQFFFQALRTNLKADIPIKRVMSDDDAALINSMIKGFSRAGFSQKIIHFLCQWHVLKKLKENLRQKVPKDLVETMFIELKIILNAENEQRFLELKEGFVHKYETNPKVSEFLLYLSQYYWPRAEKWAACYRKTSPSKINTTGHLESFHNKLKKTYLKRMVNRRLDDLIDLLCSIAWDDECSRVRNSLLGSSVQPKKLIDRHKHGLLLKDEVILGKSDKAENEWLVQTDPNKEPYTIIQIKDSCDFNDCSPKCTELPCHGLCIHLFSCSCRDHNLLCKHVHKLQSFLKKDVVAENAEFYHFVAPDNAVHESESESESNTAHNRKRSCDEQNLKSCLSTLQQIVTNELQDLPDYTVAQAATLLSDLLQNLESSRKKPVDVQTVPAMKRAVSFTPNETLKTQASQLLPFKRKRKTRKKEDRAVVAARKKAAEENLLSFVNSEKPADTCAVDLTTKPADTCAVDLTTKPVDTSAVDLTTKPVNTSAVDLTKVNWATMDWEINAD